MELPPFWQPYYNYELKQRTYINKEEGIEIPVHPGYLYIVEQLLYAKQDFLKNPNRGGQNEQIMKFYDKLNRQYEINISLLFNPNEEKSEKTNFQVANTYDHGSRADEMNETLSKNSMFDVNHSYYIN